MTDNIEISKEKFDEIKSKQIVLAEEAIKDLFHRIPFGEKITFSDGRVGTITKFFEPKVMGEEHQRLGGRLCAGIDIQFENGHLEFILYQSGWGGAV